MKHFIVSRFNINHLYYVDHDIEKALSSDWFSERIKLFYRFTYPTIVSQTVKDFKWLVLVDERTDRELLNNFLKFDIYSLITLIKVGDFNYLSVLKDVVYQLSADDNEIITTTLDSDDGVVPNFIEDIQNIYRKSNMDIPFGINLSNGFIVDCITGVFFKKSFLSNPFYSLAESKEYFQSVCQYPHHLLSIHFKTINYNEKQYWFQNVHGGNFGNVIKGFPLAPNRRIYNDFSNIYHLPGWSNYFYAILVFCFRKFHNGIIKLKRILR